MRGKTILVVEDDKEVREMIKIMLEVAGGYKVVTASNGKEGVKKANMVKPALVLLDIKMPEMDGLRTLELLKECTTTKMIPVVILTGHDEEAFKLKTGKLQAADYLLKPITADELVARIEKALKEQKLK